MADEMTSPVIDNAASAEESPERPRLPSWAVAALGVGVALPVVVATASAYDHSWWPVSDLGIEFLRSTDVGSRATPLVGPYSRFGFNHPGPAMFYLFAPFVRLFGPIGMYVATGLVNAICLGVAVVVAHRSKGARGAAIIAAAGAVLVMSMGAALLVSPWNPDVAIIPFFLAIVCAWAVGEGDPSSLVPLVVAVSYSVQSHAGYIGISMIVLAAPAVALMVRHRRRSPSVIRRHHRPIITAAVVAIGLWLPPLVQQLRTTPGNVTLLWQASGSRSGPAFGMRNALRVMAAGLLPGPGRWLTVHADIVGLPPSVPTPWLVGILLATATLGTIAAVRGHRRMFGFMVFVVALDLAGIVSIANIRGPIAPYLIGWIMPVSILTWISIFASASAILGIARARRPWYALGMSAVVLAAMLVPGSIGTEPASPRAGTGIAALGDEVAPKLSTHHRYLLEWTDDQTLSGLASGFIARLESHGIVVLVDDTSANVRAFGASRVDNQPTRADMVLRVRGTSRSGSLLMPHAGEQIILRFDERDPSIPARIAVLRPRLARLDALAGAMTRREVASGTPLEQALIDAAARYPEINVIAKELNALTGTGSAYLVTTRPID